MVRLSSSTVAVALLGVVVILGAGCATKRPPPVLPLRLPAQSFTDETSRKLALASQKRLPERTADYRVGPGDELEVGIFEWELRGETKSATFVVSESGIITIPVVDDLKVGGETLSTIKRSIETRLKDGGFILQPRVSVNIVQYRSKRVSVIGAVTEPGVYTLRQNVSTLMEMLSLAGGVSDKAGYVVQVMRPVVGEATVEVKGGEAQATAAASGIEIITLDVAELLEQGNMQLNVVVGHGDTIFVPQAKTFSVIGHVNRAGSFPLTRPTTVLDGIAMAGGLDEENASPKECYLRRNVAGEGRVVHLDLPAITNGEQDNDFLLPNDIIEVRQTDAKKYGQKFLDAFTQMISFGYRLN